jgi:hypothetical protein
MADAVIMDDNGGVRDPNDRRPAGPMGIRREEPIGGNQIPMNELVDPANPTHTITNKQLSEVTVTVDGNIVLGPIPNPRRVTVTGFEGLSGVTFTIQNNVGRTVLVTSSEDLVKPKKHAYKTGNNAIIIQVEVDGRLQPITGLGAAVVTVKYA